jgi:hypothetical protein
MIPALIGHLFPVTLFPSIFKFYLSLSHLPFVHFLLLLNHLSLSWCNPSCLDLVQGISLIKTSQILRFSVIILLVLNRTIV